jgi:hypothetical protein
VVQQSHVACKPQFGHIWHTYIVLTLSGCIKIYIIVPLKSLLGDFDAKVGREDIFKPTIGNESLHEISNDNGVRLVNFATSKYLPVKSTMFLHCKIHKVTWTPPNGKTHSQIDHILIDRRWHSSLLDVRSFRAADCDIDHCLVVAQVRDWQWANKQCTE